MAGTAPGNLIVLSGPSGSGKSTVVARLLSMPDLSLRLSVSATTRAPRPGEVDGSHYHFWTRGQFEHALRMDAFLEWADVYGQLYGTLNREVDPYLEQGTNVLLEIDVQGARQVRQKRPHCVMVFLRTSTIEEYEKRLRARGTEDEAALRRRVQAAEAELQQASSYDYQVINDDLDVAVQAMREIVASSGGKSAG